MIKIAMISPARSTKPMGFGLAELKLIEALRAHSQELDLRLHVTGGRSARRYARFAGGRWRPAPPGRTAFMAPPHGADAAHLTGLDVRPPRSGKFVATIQDLAPLRFDDEGVLPRWAAAVIEQADRILVPSRFTGEELHDLFGVPWEQIRVVHLAPGHEPREGDPAFGAGELTQLGLQGRYVLRLGGYSRRKNFPRLLEAWPEVRRRTGAQLVLVGPPSAARDDALARAASLDGVVVLDYVPADVVPRLIRAAAAVVSTSVYEGFGLPPLEAMAAGTPVVAVRAGAVEEVCGDGAYFVDDDRDALADAMSSVLRDEELRTRLTQSGRTRASIFDWRTTALGTLAVYRELLGS